MVHSDFVHLHLHTEYSLLDGAIRVEDVVKRAKELRMPALAITDHSNIFGAYEFFEKATHAGVKPILGCEVYVAPDSRFKKGGGADERDQDVARHLILLVKDEQGYRNLCVLLTAANFEGFYYKPRIDREILRRHSAGLIGLSACLKGEIAGHVLRKDPAGAQAKALEYRDIFGDGNYYFEIQENGIPEQRTVNDALIAISRDTGIPLVATNDCHYLKKEDFGFHDVLLCIQTGKTVNDEKRLRMSSNEYYFKTPDEMKERFSYAPEAVANTVRIAEACAFEFPKPSFHFPSLGIPKNEIESTFEKKVRDGFGSKIDRLLAETAGRFTRADYEERLAFEMGIISKMGFQGYFLIVADFIEESRRRGIPVGPGRGSAAGSLVSYCLGITMLDPLRYDLLFERFLNVDRISMPDVDVDFCQDRRDEVIEYIVNKYGKEMVAQIITFGSMKARLVIRDVARAMDMPYIEGDRIAKLIGAAKTIREALEIEPILARMYKEQPKVKELLDYSMSLEKLPRHTSTHAAGVVIADRPVVEYMPLHKGPKDEVLTQYPMKVIEHMGLIKFDILGLKTLTMITDIVKKVGKNHGVTIDIDNLPFDDADVYQLLSRGDTTGVFQFESQGMKDYLKKLKPTVFEDIIAMAALYRPGPLGSGMVEDFILRKHGRKAIEYDFPELKEILKDTYGIIVYQEQVMLISTHLAGFTKGEADHLRKVMGKKKTEEIPALRDKFVGGVVARGHDRGRAEKLFDSIAKFAEYGFNKSHSAAYALVAYQTAYLKAHYPLEFTAALLTSEITDTDKIVKHIGESRERGINILPPDINESEENFTVTKDGKIRFGLAAIKNVGKAAVMAIIEEREKNSRFTGFEEFVERAAGAKANKKVIESLIKSGALDSLGGHRGQFLECLDGVMQKCADSKNRKKDFMVAMFDDSGRHEARQALPDSAPLPHAQLLAFEKEVLGFYVSGHPLFEFESEMRQIVDTWCETLRNRSDGEPVGIGGIIASVRETKTKKGKKMAITVFEDLTGNTEAVLYPEVYEKYKGFLSKEGPVYIKGAASVGPDGDTSKVIVNEVMTIKDAWAREVKGVQIRVDEDTVSDDFVRELKSYFRTYQGKRQVPVVITVGLEPDIDVNVALPKDYWVDPTVDFCKNFAVFFGNCRIDLKKTEERIHG